MNRFSNQTVIVTGGNRGIGKEVALGFAREGAKVHILARTRERSQAVVEEIMTEGGTAQAWVADLSDLAGTEQCIKKLLDESQGVNVLVNNAAIVQPGVPENISLQDLDQAMRVNVSAPLLLCQLVYPWMKKAGGGKIVNVSSAYAKLSVPQATAYCVSKAALDRLSKCLAVAWAQENISVNVVSPGFVETEMTAGARSDEARYAAILANIPIQRWGQAKEIADAILFLASGEGSYAVGCDLSIDGGILTHPTFASTRR